MNQRHRKPGSPPIVATVLLLAMSFAPAVQARKIRRACSERITGETKVSPANGNLAGWFGEFVDIDGDFAAIAGTGDSENSTFNSGAVYIYHRDATGTWTQEAKIFLSPAEVGDLFGDAVAISGDTVVVGAYGKDGALPNEGLAYVFRRDAGGGWPLEATLVPSNVGPQQGSIGDQFGFSVDVSGDRIVVGATLDDDLAFDSGAAYVFERVGTTWSETTKLTASDGAGRDSRFYGNDVAVHGDTIVVGPSLDDDMGIGAGAAYIYDNVGGSWVETKVFASDAQQYDFFGRAVATDGDTVIVGANGDDAEVPGNQGLFVGAAYVFERDGTGAWNETAKLSDPNAGTSDYFGSAVAVDGNFAITGNVEFPTVVGSAFAFGKGVNGWTLLEEIIQSDAEPADPGSFGVSVAVSGDTILVGAFVEDGPAGFNAGAAYFYTIETVCEPIQTVP